LLQGADAVPAPEKEDSMRKSSRLITIGKKLANPQALDLVER